MLPIVNQGEKNSKLLSSTKALMLKNYQKGRVNLVVNKF